MAAERRLGELAKKLPTNKGTAGQGRPKKGGNSVLPPKDDTPTYADQGFEKCYES